MNLSSSNYFSGKELIRTLYKSIIIEVTRKCHKYSRVTNSMGCKHCFLDPLEQQTINRVNLHKILKFSWNHFHTIGLAGGEPFLETDLLLEVIDKYPNNLINIFTSGEVFNEVIINHLSESKNVVLTISLHGSEQHHDHLSGEGSYNKVIRNIHELNKANINWIRKTVAFSENIDYLLSSQFEKDSLELGCKVIDVCRYYPFNLKNNKIVKIDRNQFSSLDHKLKKLTKQKICIYPETYGSKCKSLITIDILGNIQACPYMRGTDFSVNTIPDEKCFVERIQNIKKNWELKNRSSYFCNLMEEYF
jgi:sulfatase maturation enzyme AslB (radical SAM superfamily)